MINCTFAVVPHHGIKGCGALTDVLFLYLHNTVRSTSALSGVCDMMLLASQRKRALLSDASAVNVYSFLDRRPVVLGVERGRNIQ